MRNVRMIFWNVIMISGKKYIFVKSILVTSVPLILNKMKEMALIPLYINESIFNSTLIRAYNGNIW